MPTKDISQQDKTRNNTLLKACHCYNKGTAATTELFGHNCFKFLVNLSDIHHSNASVNSIERDAYPTIVSLITYSL